MDEESLTSWVVDSFSPRNGGQLTARGHSEEGTPDTPRKTPKFRLGPPIVITLTLVFICVSSFNII